MIVLNASYHDSTAGNIGASRSVFWPQVFVEDDYSSLKPLHEVGHSLIGLIDEDYTNFGNHFNYLYDLRLELCPRSS